MGMEYFDEAFKEERKRQDIRQDTCRRRTEQACSILEEKAKEGELVEYMELASEINTSRGYIGPVFLCCS